MRDIVLIGAGSWTRSIVPLFGLEKAILQFYDDPKSEGEEWFGVPVSKDILLLSDPYGLKFNAPIGDPRWKRTLIDEVYVKIENPKFVNFIWPKNIIVKTARLGKGIMIQPTAKVYHNVEIDDHVSICGDGNIGHDSHIGKYCTLGPYVLMGGNVDVRDGVFLGAGCKILPGRTIGEGSIIGAGAVVVKDVPPNTVCRLEKPARVMRGLEDIW